MVAADMFFIVYYLLNLILFTAAIVFAVSKLRNTSATHNARLLPFAYFSLSAWIVGALQYVVLLAGLITSFPNRFFLDTGLWLGITQNALWISAVLSLHSKLFPRISDTLPLFKIFPIVIAFALLTYRTAVLTSEVFTLIDGVSTATIFIIFASWILQWPLSKKFAALFFIHGYSQWIWRSLWFTPFAGAQFAILFVFPLWRIALLVAWIRLVSAMLRTAQSSQIRRLLKIEST